MKNFIFLDNRIVATWFEHPDINLSMSFGVVYGSGKVEDMITKADDALYISKEKRDTITLVNKEKDKVLRK